MELPAAAIDTILESWPIAALTTLGAGGRPHAVPIVFARAAGALWSPIDGKPKAGRELARVRNVRGDPRVSLLIHHYDPDWMRLWWLRADGAAEVRIRRDPAEAELAAAIAALRRKYPQYESVAVLGPDATLLRIRVASVRSWCASAAGVEAALASSSSGVPA